jgi:hypothetical protein
LRLSSASRQGGSAATAGPRNKHREAPAGPSLSDLPRANAAAPRRLVGGRPRSARAQRSVKVGAAAAKALVVPAPGLTGTGPAAAPGRGERRGGNRVAAGGVWAAARARCPASGFGRRRRGRRGPFGPRTSDLGRLGAAAFARGRSEREGPAGVCSSFYEGPAGADDPVARPPPVGAPGPTNRLMAGGKGPGGGVVAVPGSRPRHRHRHHPRHPPTRPGPAPAPCPAPRSRSRSWWWLRRSPAACNRCPATVELSRAGSPTRATRHVASRPVFLSRCYPDRNCAVSCSPNNISDHAIRLFPGSEPRDQCDQAAAT